MRASSVVILASVPVGERWFATDLPPSGLYGSIFGSVLIKELVAVQTQINLQARELRRYLKASIELSLF